MVARLQAVAARTGLAFTACFFFAALLAAISMISFPCRTMVMRSFLRSSSVEPPSRMTCCKNVDNSAARSSWD